MAAIKYVVTTGWQTAGAVKEMQKIGQVGNISMKTGNIADAFMRNSINEQKKWNVSSPS